MKRHDNRIRGDERKGAALLTSMVFLLIASLSLGSILQAFGTYSRLSKVSSDDQKAFYLADAGIAVACALLNAQQSGIVASLPQSHQYFDDHSVFAGSTNWGFTTEVNASQFANALNVVATGQYNDQIATVSCRVSRGWGDDTIHSLFTHAIYAGNSSSDPNYILDLGGATPRQDLVNGDVYCGNDIAVSGDAILRYAEEFTDQQHFTNGFPVPTNGYFDSDEQYVDRHAFVGTWPDVFTRPATAQEYNNYRTNDFSNCYTNNRYDLGEMFVDLNSDGVYNNGEPYVDDRNGHYDYGTTAIGTITGMNAPPHGTLSAAGGNDPIDPPPLDKMYYNHPASLPPPADVASSNRYGYNVLVDGSAYGGSPIAGINSTAAPQHIFVRNPPNSDRGQSSGTYGGVYLPRRDYQVTTNAAGAIAKDDYFIEDPADSTYNNTQYPASSNGKSTKYLNVQSSANNLTYYVDGNVWLHDPQTKVFKFRRSGTRLTIVANGNVTISDELFYDGWYCTGDGEGYWTADPTDALCLIALKDPSIPDSGNIRLGDAQFGTAGEIHAMLYAENNFIDNNLDTAGAPILRVYGNMSAGNHIQVNRSGTSSRTQLIVDLDSRIRDAAEDQGHVFLPGLPPAVTNQVEITISTMWAVAPGSWRSFCRIGDFAAIP